jgi:hypothetical protein
VKPFLLILACVFFNASPAWGSTDGTIIQVTRKLKMTASETSPAKQYWLDVGERNGIKAEDTFEVYRTIGVVNGITGEPSGIFRVLMGEVKVSMVGEFTSLAKVSQQREAKDLPVMDFPWLMVGDQVKLKTSLPFK